MISHLSSKVVMFLRAVAARDALGVRAANSGDTVRSAAKLDRVTEFIVYALG